MQQSRTPHILVHIRMVSLARRGNRPARVAQLVCGGGEGWELASFPGSSRLGTRLV